MTVTIRKRRRSRTHALGTQILRSTGKVVATGSLSSVYYMEDVVGSPDTANYLYATQRIVNRPGTITGKANFFPTYIYKNFPYLNQGVGVHAALPTIPPTLADAITRTAAATNPSKPEVSVPVFIAQLKDLPRSLQRYGDPIHDRPHHSKGENHGTAVDYNFGWDLLYKDVAKMFSFTHQVDQRVKQLKATYGPRGSRGRWTVWNDSTYTISNQVVWSLEATITAIRTTSTSSKMWGSVHWAADDPNMPDATEILHRARRIVHGWRIAPADVWELIPWSWFIDYFVNVGDYLEATQNSLGIHSERGCVMQETITYAEDNIPAANISDSGFTASPARHFWITKNRSPATPSLTLHSIPFIGTKQLVTLASIASTHVRGF